jgi:hypothetical protein
MPVLNKLLTGGFKSELTSILVNTFGTSDLLDLTVKNLPHPASWGDAGTFYQPAGDGAFITMTLNTTELQNSSQEFVAETIFHEVIHAYLDANTPIKNALLQHHEMITSYVDCELAALKEIFPTLSSHDGLCIILGGMYDVQQYDTATFNSVLAVYALTSADVVNTNSSYKTSGKGSSCSTLL